MGACVSAESGIPTFRDAITGLWKNYQAETLASAKGFRNDPALWFCAGTNGDVTWSSLVCKMTSLFQS